MSLPWGRQVPFTSAASGIVFVLVVFNISRWWTELEIFAAWGLAYLVECLARDLFGLRRHIKLPVVRAALLSGVLLLGGVLAAAVHAARPVPTLLYAGCYLAAGWGPLRVGFRAALRRSIDVELLMVLAALCAAGTGKTVDGALLFVIFTSARALAAVATDRTEESVRSLLTLTPEHAIKIMPEGGPELVPAASLVASDEIVVRPGDRIAADGAVLSGTSEVDQASITGEPLPVRKGAGDEVFAGTINGVGLLRIRVSRAGAESVVARISAQVEQASATKARTQVVLERIERRYSLAVVVATATILLMPFMLGTPVKPALLRAMAFMIVASPCALTVATMPALLAAIANASRHGVLVKGAVVMERLSQVTTVAFDKTGSLTTGVPQVVDVIPLPGCGLDAGELVRFAAGAEQASEHPLAKAVLAEAAARGLDVPEQVGFRAEPGLGVHAQVEGRQVTVASPSSVDRATRDMTTAVGITEEAGTTALVVLIDDRPVGVLGVIDQVRPDAAQAIELLRPLTDDEPIMLTGDNHEAARHAARRAGIGDIRAQLLPADKVTVVSSLQAGGKRVTYVGDGINDAPALATADVGVAMAHGADLALESSDVVIVNGHLATLPAMIRLSHLARRVLAQNLIFAATVIVALVSIDLAKTLPLPLAVAGHEGSTLLVAMNGLRLARAGAWREAPPPARPPLTAERLRRHLIIAGSILVLGAWAAHQLTT